MLVLGVDVGQAADYSTCVFLEVIPAEPKWVEESEWTDTTVGPVKLTTRHLVEPENKETLYHIRSADRWRGKPYPEIVSIIAKRARQLPEPPIVAVDTTGCGAPVADLFALTGVNLVRVHITGGDNVRFEDGKWRVPKRDLVAAVQVELQRGTLKIANGQPWTRLLTDELQNFRVTIDPVTSHDSYSSWRERQHDDLVLGTAVGLWTAQRDLGVVRIIDSIFI